MPIPEDFFKRARSYHDYIIDLLIEVSKAVKATCDELKAQYDNMPKFVPTTFEHCEPEPVPIFDIPKGTFCVQGFFDSPNPEAIALITQGLKLGCAWAEEEAKKTYDFTDTQIRELVRSGE